MAHELTVKGMHCKSCKMLIEDELEDLGAQDVEVTMDDSAQEGKVRFDHDDPQAVADAIEALGDYEVER